MNGPLIASLTVIPVVLYLYFFLWGNIGEGVRILECNVETCSHLIVNDTNLEVQLVTTDLNAPTNMAFIGNDDILVLERYTGKIMRVLNDTIQPEPLLDVNVANGQERGLLGIAVSK